MALFDLQPVDLNFGERLLPNASLTVKYKCDKDLAPEQRTAEAEAEFRKQFKTTSITLTPANYKPISYQLDAPSHSRSGPYIRSEQKTAQEMEDTIEYDLDEEDQIFLNEENAKRNQKKGKKIEDEQFELVMDRLEKETYFKNANNDGSSVDGSDHLDDDCCICGNGDVENVNQIIYCDMCNIAVHQDCYGVPYIPEGQWLCRKCKLSPMEAVKCELCPLRDGAFKPTAEGKWAHVSCAIWLNEVHFGNTAFLEPIEGVHNSLRRRQKLRCLVCKTKVGACLQCSKGSCVKSFHVTCAKQAKLQMITNTIEDPKSPDGVTVKRFVYCHLHGSVKVGENEFAKNKKRAIEAINRARKRVEEKVTTASTSSVPTVDTEAKKRIEDRVGEMGEDIVQDIMGFWFYKRKKRCGLPLIRRLQIKKKIVPRVKTPRDYARDKGRVMYERARLLSELTQKREKHYLECVSMERKIMSTLFTPLDDILDRFITDLIPIDHLRFYREDPVVQGLKDYNTRVKKPMWLNMMRKNAQEGLYETERKMKEHLDLIFKNAESYNHTNDDVLGYTREIQQKMNKMYDDLVEYLKFMEKWYEDMVSSKKGVNNEVKKEVKEEMTNEQKELRDTATPRNEPNKRKRKLDSIKQEDRSETPLRKRDRITKDKDKDALKEKETPKEKDAPNSVFAASLYPMPPHLRRFSVDSKNTPRLDSNSNKSPQRRMTRGSTQLSFGSYREIPTVLSPEMGGVTSCDSAVDSDMEMNNVPDIQSRESLSRSSLSDPNSLHHGDLVKAKGVAGRVVIPAEGLLEDPQLYDVISRLKPSSSDILVQHFKRESPYAVYAAQFVAPLNINKDKAEGMREAREWSRMICSK